METQSISLLKKPYITYKIGHGLYTNHEVDLECLERPGEEIPPETYSWDSPVHDSKGLLTSECRGALLEHGKSVSARTGINLCVVYAEDDCDYVSPDGTVLWSDQPPYLMKRVDGREERYEIIGLPEIVKNPEADPLEQAAWVRKMLWLQVATSNTSAPWEKVS